MHPLVKMFYSFVALMTVFLIPSYKSSSDLILVGSSI